MNAIPTFTVPCPCCRYTDDIGTFSIPDPESSWIEDGGWGDVVCPRCCEEFYLIDALGHEPPGGWKELLVTEKEA